jgi:hypothetical protein
MQRNAGPRRLSPVELIPDVGRIQTSVAAGKDDAPWAVRLTIATTARNVHTAAMKPGVGVGGHRR